MRVLTDITMEYVGYYSAEGYCKATHVYYKINGENAFARLPYHLSATEVMAKLNSVR